MELLTIFDPVTKYHIHLVESGPLRHTSYLENVIQNEKIASISRKIQDSMVAEVKLYKYYSLILDCTLDVSHQEQVSAVMTVKIDEALGIKEHLLGVLVASQVTGLGLSSLI